MALFLGGSHLAAGTATGILRRARTRSVTWAQACIRHVFSAPGGALGLKRRPRTIGNRIQGRDNSSVRAALPQAGLGDAEVILALMLAYQKRQIAGTPQREIGLELREDGIMRSDF